MTDVAAAAGVSTKTVSRVVNNEAGVARDKAQRVLDAITTLGYSRDIGASALRRAHRHSGSIGALLDDVSNPFSSTIHRAIEEEARRNHAVVLTASSDLDERRMSELVGAFVERRVDGLVVMHVGGDNEWLFSDQLRGTPLVFIDRPSPVPLADSVLADSERGAFDAVVHLASRGHRRIALLTDEPRLWTARARERGYQRAVRELGLETDPQLFRSGVADEALAASSVLALLELDEPPTALLTARNTITIGAVRMLHRMHAHRRIAVVGFDDVPMADVLDPGVTVVAQSVEHIGRTAATLLFQRITDPSRDAQRVLVPTHLVPRGSGEIPAAQPLAQRSRVVDRVRASL